MLARIFGGTSSMAQNASSRVPVLGIAFLLAVPAAVILVAEPVRADSTTTMTATLPWGREETSAVWDGSNAYIFGGYDETLTLNEIVQYNPLTDAVVVVSRLPTARTATSAVWDGTNAYIFGGVDDSYHRLNEIVRYNPAANTITTMSATLPTGRFATSAVWDGLNAYIFGGWDGSNLDQIVRYNPATDTVTTMSATLPMAQNYASAIWDGSNAYIFYANKIMRYNPATDTATMMSATLPTTQAATSAVWDGSNAYIFGGNSANYDQIVRYNPATNTVSTMSAPLPTARTGTSAIWNGLDAYIFGGRYGWDALDSIVRYEVREPGSPQNLTAVAGPGFEQITVNWQAPPSNTYSAPITNYRIYRSTASGGEVLLVQVGNVLTYTDTTCPIGNTCFYKVTAVNVWGEGTASNEASATGSVLPSDIIGFTVGLATDSDGDTYSNVDEVQGHSDPTNPNSNPTSDDDGDCTANAQESDFLDAQGIDHPMVFVDAGLTVDPAGPSADLNPDVSIRPGGSSC